MRRCFHILKSAILQEQNLQIAVFSLNAKFLENILRISYGAGHSIGRNKGMSKWLISLSESRVNVIIKRPVNLGFELIGGLDPRWRRSHVRVYCEVHMWTSTLHR